MRVTCRSGKVTIEGSETRTVETEKPLEVIRSLLKDYRSPLLEGMPPFTGGFVGYFSYSMIGYAELVLKLSGGDTFDFDMMLFDKVIAYDI
jgi:anthranilate synthase component 1